MRRLRVYILLQSLVRHCCIDFEEKNELLVCRRAKAPAKGTLDLPGGFIDMTETGEEGVAREVLEETGLKVEKTTYLFTLPNIYVYSGSRFIHWTCSSSAE